MSQIPEALWRREFGDDRPMPEGCTYWQFAAAVKVRDTFERVKNTQESIRQLEAVARKHPQMATEIQAIIDQEVKDL